MNRRLSGVAHSVLRECGLEVRKTRGWSNPHFRLLSCIRRFGINSIIDVGANEGQFAREMRRVGFNGTIVSFEPLPSAFHELQRRTIKENHWTAHQTAIGGVNGTLQFNVSQNSVSSSALRVLDTSIRAAPSSAHLSTIEVQVTRLDSINLFALAGVTLETSLLKIDTQGYEWEVLQGAGQLLKSFPAVVCELSLVPLYQGQRLWGEIIDLLQQNGFQLWSLERGFTDKTNGRMLQCDGAFIRNGLLNT